MRLLASHLLVALVALGVGYAAAPELAGWLASEPHPVVNPRINRASVLSVEEGGDLEGGDLIACEPYRSDLLRLQLHVEELEQMLSASDENGGGIDYPPVDAPVGLEARFRERALLEAFRRAASDEAHDVEIASVDCTEYPCIIYGHVRDEEDVLEAFLAAPGFEAYREGAATMTFSWGDARLPEIEEPRRYFGAVFFPQSDEDQRREKIRGRLRFRSQQMWEAVRGEGEGH